jgi:hypothetical protein
MTNEQASFEQDNYLDITGLDKAKVLAAFFNSSAPTGLGFLQAEGAPTEMSLEQAQSFIEAGTSPDPGSHGNDDLYFDYLLGRPLKLDLSGDAIDPWGYDRDNGGTGTAKAIIKLLRDTDAIASEETLRQSRERTLLNAHEAMDFANTISSIGGGIISTLGADELGEPLQKSIDRVIDQLDI